MSPDRIESNNGFPDIDLIELVPKMVVHRPSLLDYVVKCKLVIVMRFEIRQLKETRQRENNISFGWLGCRYRSRSHDL